MKDRLALIVEKFKETLDTSPSCFECPIKRCCNNNVEDGGECICNLLDKFLLDIDK